MLLHVLATMLPSRAKHGGAQQEAQQCDWLVGRLIISRMGELVRGPGPASQSQTSCSPRLFGGGRAGVAACNSGGRLYGIGHFDYALV